MNTVLYGDCLVNLRSLHDLGFKVQMCVTSPPYFGLRSYLPGDHPDKALEMGCEETPELFIARLVEVFRVVRDLLVDDGTLWVNIGDSYASRGGQGAQSGNAGRQRDHARSNRFSSDDVKEKDLIGIPWMLAFALRADGWYLRQDIIWHKPNPMPESATDRCTKAHEYLFLLSKSPKYLFDNASIKEPSTGRASGNKTHKSADRVANEVAENNHQERTKIGLKNIEVSELRNKRSVWTVASKPYAGAHVAVYPPALIEPCILACSRPGDIVLDPFIGSGTTAAVAVRHGRQYIGCDLDKRNGALIAERVALAEAA